MDLHWELLIEYEASIRRMLRRLSIKYEEELWSEVVLDRIERIVELWDGERHPKPYIISNLRWYAFKWLQKLETHHEIWDVERSYTETKHITRDAVNNILSRMNEYDALILQMYHIGSYTFQEIADSLGISKATANNHYHKAMREARAIVSKMK